MIASKSWQCKGVDKKLVFLMNGGVSSGGCVPNGATLSSLLHSGFIYKCFEAFMDIVHLLPDVILGYLVSFMLSILFCSFTHILLCCCTIATLFTCILLLLFVFTCRLMYFCNIVLLYWGKPCLCWPQIWGRQQYHF